MELHAYLKTSICLFTMMLMVSGYPNIKESLQKALAGFKIQEK